VHSALAGSTNAMVHLVAIARQAGVPISLKDFDEIASRVPVIVNLRPSGKWLMEEFHCRWNGAAVAARSDAASRCAHGSRDDGGRNWRCAGV
jgi:dihydroxy-acid dehydratase